MTSDFSATGVRALAAKIWFRDSVLKFTEAGGHGQLRRVQVPIGIGEGVYYLDLLQQETVRLLTLEFTTLCWLAPRYIAADLGVSNMGVKAVYGLPVPVFFDLETWRRVGHCVTRTRVCGSLWPDTSRVCSLACRLSFATTLKKLLEVCQQLLADEYTGESVAQAQGRYQV